MDLIKAVFSDVSRGQMPPMDVLTLLATRVLGYCITLGATMVKVPQILTVHKSKSIKGLSILSFELDLFIPAIHSSYGYIMGLDISAYGEAVMSFLQGVILVHAIYRYGKVPMRRQSMIFALLCLGGALVYSGQVSKAQISTAYILNQVFFSISRGTQIFHSFKAKSTGQLSLISNLLMTVGCMMRILTSLREKASLVFVLGFVQGTLLNGIVTAQILYNQPKKAVKKD